MEAEIRQIFTQDLINRFCANTKCKIENSEEIKILRGASRAGTGIYDLLFHLDTSIMGPWNKSTMYSIDKIKPYFRSISTMTKEDCYKLETYLLEKCIDPSMSLLLNSMCGFSVRRFYLNA